MFNDELITVPPRLVADILYWLDVLAESNDDPGITETICALALRIEGQQELHRAIAQVRHTSK